VIQSKLEELRRIYGDSAASAVLDERFKRVEKSVADASKLRATPYAGFPTLLGAPSRQLDWENPDLSHLQVALLGIPMDLGVSNRNGARFGPRALRSIERIGPYNHVLENAAGFDLSVADIGDIPILMRHSLPEAHEVIERHIRMIADAGVLPLSVGGDHSIDRPILRALGRDEPVGLIHIDAHCDTSGGKFGHGGPFRQAVLDGVLDPERTVQIGIRGPSEYFWEFSYRSGMTVIHAEEIDEIGIKAVIEKARQVIGDGPTYLTFDIDSLDPSFAPGTGTPEIGGLTTREAQAILRGMKGVNLVGADLVEVAPQYDSTTMTVIAGAQILFEILSLFPFSNRIGSV
jgi:agmatinase